MNQNTNIVAVFEVSIESGGKKGTAAFPYTIKWQPFLHTGTRGLNRGLLDPSRPCSF